MIVYHGTNLTVEKPKHGFSKKYLDFGEGFYVTIYEEQLSRMHIYRELEISEKQIEAENIYDSMEALAALREKHEV